MLLSSVIYETLSAAYKKSGKATVQFPLHFIISRFLLTEYIYFNKSISWLIGLINKGIIISVHMLVKRQYLDYFSSLRFSIKLKEKLFQNRNSSFR
ncbi:hypothetical protein RIR_jg19824.t1 [Rhizophagus irregularis DAOM 181602=DAOM 197198]|nr:hypothetical protein RIR_jg19824.t1 [Rhizophagus irregularis DAOM 181602=DAOM 197198]